MCVLYSTDNFIFALPPNPKIKLQCPAWLTSKNLFYLLIDYIRTILPRIHKQPEDRSSLELYLDLQTAERQRLSEAEAAVALNKMAPQARQERQELRYLEVWPC